MRWLRSAVLVLALLLALATAAHAAPAPTHLIGTTTGASGQIQTTASFSITANRLVLFSIICYLDAGTGCPTPTLTGHSATWVAVCSVAQADPERKLFVFRTMVSSNQTSALEVNWGATTNQFGVWSASEWSGVDPSGTNGSVAIVQCQTNSGTGVTSLAVTLNAYGSSDNRPVAFWRVGANEELTAESGWTEIFDSGTGGAHGSQWRDDTTDTTPSHSSATAVDRLGVAIEIKAAAGRPGGWLPAILGPR